MSGTLMMQVAVKGSGDAASELKRISVIIERLNKLQKELGKLEILFPGKSEAVALTAGAARKSVDASKEAAFRLRSNPDNKKLMAGFSKSTGVAFRDARKAKKAADDLEQLKKNIEIIKIKISNNRQTLDKLVRFHVTADSQYRQ